MTTAYLTIPSPVGELLLTATDEGLTRVWFEENRHGGPRSAEWRRADEVGGAAERILRSASEQLGAYFAGNLTSFDIPLAASGTPFQERVWKALRDIPFGHTTSYGEIAVRMGEPKAVRAVGAANGRNPIAIVVPCHRVIGARGDLTGFGGGIERKRWLLEHEGALPREMLAESA
ncbi:MAG TPA: methylated-DNA--[protein]-cysteine S-methyltransferase [Gemmatimonadaceae bacterium]|jgi:O-6-methylguanine DNA methyltransferase